MNLDSAGLTLGTYEFLVFSGVNFETSGLVFLDIKVSSQSLVWIYISFLFI